jgi:hypothetical protein
MIKIPYQGFWRTLLLAVELGFVKTTSLRGDIELHFILLPRDVTRSLSAIEDEDVCRINGNAL